ncbi:amine oxidase catalytic domain-containing protein [Gymnopus androsaceus JB14]|uniref:Amine oxidase n=1 Tax=Gymnopus androsaceus JB14 TaxID=1447944 RepID=A0A6A4HAC0_9AGAR|nr:amine oxidase catalytic domain-containing protein [Gymnopus androsaceus JB14]
MSSQRGYQRLPAKSDEGRQLEDRRDGIISRRRFGLLFSICAVTLFCLFLIAPPKTVHFTDIAGNYSRGLEECAAPISHIAKPPVPINLWASLTVPEITEIQKWLEAPERQLNLTRGPISSISDNVVFLIETYYPPKAEALAYLAGGSAPDKYARVTIQHGGLENPVVRNYLVGPLPVGERTVIRPLTEIYHESEIPFDARGMISILELQQLFKFITPELSNAMQDLFGATARGAENDTLIVSASGPFSFDGTKRKVWYSFRRNVAGPWLLPINFWQYVDVSGTDPSLWKVLKVVYNHQVFESTEGFLEAFRNGTLIRSPETLITQDKDYSWTTRKRVGKPRDLDHLPGPRSVSFAGLRFRVDQETQYISWMSWGMYLGFDRDMGLSLWDITLQGERIIYQLAPQEAIAQYAGNDPLQATTAWQDRYFGMGSSVQNLLPGYDCPLDAVYLPATTYSAMGTIIRDKAICVFEQDTGRPVTRHTGYMDGEFGAVKGYMLTVRTISVFDYMFHIDGTMEVRVSASGYIQGGYWEPLQEGYGGKIRETSMGNVHDHVINYKVDLDIAGLENSLLETTTAQEAVVQPWFVDDEWGSTVIQQKITKRIIETEDEALLKVIIPFINQNQTNAWGIPRGYAIHAGYSPVHNTVVGSRRLLNNANWARYNLAVSLQKDTELSSSSMWNMNLPGKPTVDFHKFFDGENITQEDLVVWINVGTHHLPQAEDSPNTKTTVAMSSFLLTPLNYFDSDISLNSANAILLSAPSKPGDPWSFDDYGVKQEYTCIPQTPASFDYPLPKVYDADGQLNESVSLEDARKLAEMYHRIKIEL